MTPAGRPIWGLWAVLALSLGARCFELGAPLIDQQAWRQCDTAAIARNFFAEEFNPLYPRVDWRGDTAGYVEANFPLFPFLVACLYAVAGGAHEWIGRLLAALFSTAAAYLLYGLARRVGLSEWGGVAAAFLYTVFPLNLFFGRAFMPEAAMLFLSLAALSVFAAWCDRPRIPLLLGAAGTAGLCFMVKVPTLYLGFPLVALAWQRWGWGFLRLPALWAYLVLVLIPPLAWHAHAHGLFAETGLTFGVWNQEGYDKWNAGLLVSADFYAVLARRFAHNILTPFGALLAAGGLWALRRRPQALFLYVWLAGLCLYVLLVAEGNRKLHYYQLPFVPVAALFAAAAIQGLGERCGRWPAFGLAALVSCYSVWAVGDYYRPANNVYAYYRACWQAGRALDARLPADALVVVGDLDENAGARNRAQNPSLLYYMKRKGWQITPDEYTVGRLDSLAGLGGGYFVGAGHFAMARGGFWGQLLERGVSVVPAYPRRWYDGTGFLRDLAQVRGEGRDFLVVDLGSPRP